MILKGVVGRISPGVLKKGTRVTIPDRPLRKNHMASDIGTLEVPLAVATTRARQSLFALLEFPIVIEIDCHPDTTSRIQKPIAALRSQRSGGTTAACHPALHLGLACRVKRAPQQHAPDGSS